MEFRKMMATHKEPHPREIKVKGEYILLFLFFDMEF